MVEFKYLLTDENGQAGAQLKFFAGEKKTINFWIFDTTGKPKSYNGVSEIVLSFSNGDGTFLEKRYTRTEVNYLTYGYANCYLSFSAAETQAFFKNNGAGIPQKVNASMFYEFISGGVTYVQEKFDFPECFLVYKTTNDLTP